MQKQDYSIGDTARITGVTEKQLRHWEDRGYIQGINRVVCGARAYRIYSEDQIQLLTAIKGYLNEGFTLSVAAEKANKNSLKEGE